MPSNFKKLTFFSISANSSHGTTSSGSGSGQPTAAANAALAAAQWSHQGRQGQYLFICSFLYKKTREIAQKDMKKLMNYFPREIRSPRSRRSI